MARAALPLFALERPPAGSPDAWLLRARLLDPRLVARTRATRTRGEHPGTALRIEGELYEVVGCEPASPPWEAVYRLRPFPEPEAVRTSIDFSPAGQARFESGAREEAARGRRLARLYRILPLVGMLPANHQQALEREVGIVPQHATRLSGWVLLLPSVAFAAYTFLARMAGALAQGGDVAGMLWLPPFWLFALAAALAVESILRIRSADPCGSFPVVLAVRGLEALGLLAPAPPSYAEPDLEKSAPPGSRPDRLDRLPAAGGEGIELRIECDEPRRWEAGSCFLYQGRMFQVLEAREEQRGERRVWTYRAITAPPEALARAAEAYQPDDRQIERARAARRDRADRLDLLKPIYGFAPARLQRRWAAEYGFDARAATFWSALIETALPLPALYSALLLLPRLPALWIVLPVLLLPVIEGARRLSRVRRTGQPSGTVLLAWLDRADASRARRAGRRGASPTGARSPRSPGPAR